MDDAFDADRDAVLARARAAGVDALVLVGYDLPSSRAAVDLARRIGWARASVGIHPNSVDEASEGDFEAIADLARAPEVVGIGETGLDYYRDHTPPSRQRRAFDWHLRLAEKLDLPAIVHNRQADADVAEALSASAARGASRATPGVLHCFTSTDSTYLQRLLDAGYFVSFAGMLTFNSADELRSMARRVPADRLLVETDCPYLAPTPHRGRRNEPAFVRETAMCMADVIGVEFEAFAQQLWANSLHVFPAFERIGQEVA
jgi:TatD DNase family protein